MEGEKEEELQDTDEFSILSYIKKEMEDPYVGDSKEYFSFEDICYELKWDQDRKSRQRLGFLVKKKLLLHTRRLNFGTVIPLDKKNMKRLNYLFERFQLN